MHSHADNPARRMTSIFALAIGQTTVKFPVENANEEENAQQKVFAKSVPGTGEFSKFAIDVAETFANNILKRVVMHVCNLMSI